MNFEPLLFDYVNGHLSPKERGMIDKARETDPDLDQAIRNIQEEMSWVRESIPLLEHPVIANRKSNWRWWLAAGIAAASLLWILVPKSTAEVSSKLQMVLQTENPKIQIYLVENIPNLWEQP